MSKNQQRIINFLKKKSAYPHKVSKIDVLETHISWVLLTGKFAYKIKKGVKFGNILDFSSLGLRKKFCHKEINLNKILCNKMYLQVVKVIQESGAAKLVNLDQKGKPLEYAVKMLEMPQKYRMDRLLARRLINRKTIDTLVNALVKFHGLTPTNTKIASFGRPENMRKKVDENFTTLSKLTKVNPLLEKKLVSFIQDNNRLFKERIQQRRVRDIHGDLYLQNIFVMKNKFYLYDRMEFNDILRYADVAEDVSHLAMDLDYHKREDLKRHFISKYIAKSKDRHLDRILYFLMCYKACVRAKVARFRAKSEENKRRKFSQIKESKKLLKLAKSYLDFF